MVTHNKYRAGNLEFWGTADVRKVKKLENKMVPSSLVYSAWLEGCEDGSRAKPYRNRYPAGRRHDEYKRGYDNADPMGDFFGRNV